MFLDNLEFNVENLGHGDKNDLGLKCLLKACLWCIELCGRTAAQHLILSLNRIFNAENFCLGKLKETRGEWMGIISPKGTKHTKDA